MSCRSSTILGAQILLTTHTHDPTLKTELTTSFETPDLDICRILLQCNVETQLA